MKQKTKIITLVALICYTLQSFAQTDPLPVYSIVRAVHDFDWYDRQAKAWKQEIDKGSTDKMAWINYYKANRMIWFFDSDKITGEKTSYLLPLEDILKRAEKVIPNTFELYAIEAYENGCYSEKGRENLVKAQKLRPFDPSILPDLMNYYQYQNDKANIELTSKKWLECGEMPEGLLAITYNKLMSVEPNAILLVNGDNDTYPFWVLQNAKKIRPDVLILNVSLLGIDTYRERVFGENNIPQVKLVKSPKISNDVLKHIIEKVKDKPVYVSIHLDNELYKDYENKMYLTGLALKYSEKPFDNLAVLQNNFENKFFLDDLKLDFRNDYGRDIVNQTNLSYLAVFLKLYDHYLQSGEVQKAQKIKELAKIVSENVGKTDWLGYFEK